MIVKNLDNKTVCSIDENKRTVEIVKKSCKTVISFAEDKIKIENFKLK
ncbi:hypothetical protein HMPREF1143_0453 [Peptoanaerobacter stomatis]|uniref:Uncharacterized protein n=1 Tax=Peptoanaerobacter stomatis TaxID=796937 RepID=J6HA56_9FIRM|nr:hypothetical protein [Peptoanaerobacter stomatis]EJU22045.1 hypothetical protein HMPREF1143_0453 [Peptoanaerobacter stomatis]